MPTRASITSTNNIMVVPIKKEEYEYEEAMTMDEQLSHHHPPTPTSTKSGESNTVPVTQSQPVLDLREWKGHRVLAKRESVYMPGVIIAVSGHSTITVTFDADGISVAFTDVILSAASFYDIVSDASPTPSQVDSLLILNTTILENINSMYLVGYRRNESMCKSVNR